MVSHGIKASIHLPSKQVQRFFPFLLPTTGLLQTQFSAWYSSCFHRQTSFGIPGNLSPSDYCDQGRTNANAIRQCQALAMHSHLLSLPSCCCNVPSDPQEAQRDLICTLAGLGHMLIFKASALPVLVT